MRKLICFLKRCLGSIEQCKRTSAKLCRQWYSKQWSSLRHQKAIWEWDGDWNTRCVKFIHYGILWDFKQNYILNFNYLIFDKSRFREMNKKVTLTKFFVAAPKLGITVDNWIEICMLQEANQQRVKFTMSAKLIATMVKGQELTKTRSKAAAFLCGIRKDVIKINSVCW